MPARLQDRVAAGDAGVPMENPFYPTNVVVHPLVLLSTVDHFLRVNPKGGKGRVVGVLLGEVWQGRVDVTNSFAVPFDEDDKSQGVWYLDHDYLEKMSRMFKKVAAKEKIVGWYSTGPKIKPIDIQINHLFRDWGQGAAKDPVFVIIDVDVKQDQLPSEAYVAVEEVSSEAATTEWTFKHLASEIGAFEAEEIGVEHLLRDIKDTTISTLTQDVESKVSSLRSLLSHIELMAAYLRKVNTGELPINHTVRHTERQRCAVLAALAEPRLPLQAARCWALSAPQPSVAVAPADVIERSGCPPPARPVGMSTHHLPFSFFLPLLRSYTRCRTSSTCSRTQTPRI